MANITKEIETLRAKIAQLEDEQKKAEKQEKALATVTGQIDELLKESELNLEDYVRGNYAKINRIVTKIEREKAKSAPPPSKRATKKRASAKKRGVRGKAAKSTMKIPAGKYGIYPPRRIRYSR
jgi:phage shock protein A